MAVAQMLSPEQQMQLRAQSIDQSYVDYPTVQSSPNRFQILEDMGIVRSSNSINRTNSTITIPGKNNPQWAEQLANILLNITGGNIGKLNSFKLPYQQYHDVMMKVGNGEIEKATKKVYVDTTKGIPEVTYITDKQIRFGNNRWIEKYKYDYCVESTDGKGGWIYDKAKSELGATTFGAKLLETFAIEEGRWGKGNGGEVHHNPFSLLSSSPPAGYPSIYSGHGYVQGFPTWEAGFDAFWTLINSSYPEFAPLIKQEFATEEDINKALNSGPYFGEYPSYTNSDKGKAILGTMKYTLVFNKSRLQQQINLLNTQIEALSILPVPNLGQLMALEALMTQYQKEMTDLEEIYKLLQSKF